MSSESTQELRKLKSDIHNYYIKHKKVTDPNSVFSSSRFGFIDIIVVVGTVKAMFMILSW